MITGGEILNTKPSTGKTAKIRHSTTTSKGFRIRTDEMPPAGFNPLAATPRLVLHHGFPARPDAKAGPQLRQMRDKAPPRTRTGVTPVFREVQGKSHGPARRPGKARAKVSASRGARMPPAQTGPAASRLLLSGAHLAGAQGSGRS
jgi:hypothetical protein